MRGTQFREHWKSRLLSTGRAPLQTRKEVIANDLKATRAISDCFHLNFLVVNGKESELLERSR